MRKLIAPSGGILTFSGINSWFFRSAGELLGKPSRAGAVCHWPRLTVVFVRRPSISIATGVVGKRNSIVTIQMIDSQPHTARHCHANFPPSHAPPIPTAGTGMFMPDPMDIDKPKGVALSLHSIFYMYGDVYGVYTA